MGIEQLYRFVKNVKVLKDLKWNSQATDWTLGVISEQKTNVRWPGLEAVECWAGPERPWPKSWDFNGGNELEATGQTNGERKELFWEILSCICFLLSPLIMGLNVCLHVYLWWFWDSTDATLAAEDTNSIPTLSHVWAVCSEFIQARRRYEWTAKPNGTS